MVERYPATQSDSDWPDEPSSRLQMAETLVSILRPACGARFTRLRRRLPRYTEPYGTGTKPVMGCFGKMEQGRFYSMRNIISSHWWNLSYF